MLILYYTERQNNLVYKNKILIKSFILNCVLTYCVYGDVTQLEVVVFLLVALYIYVYVLVGRISHDII
jgi:hypothetical protein